MNAPMAERARVRGSTIHLAMRPLPASHATAKTMITERMPPMTTPAVSDGGTIARPIR